MCQDSQTASLQRLLKDFQMSTTDQLGLTIPKAIFAWSLVFVIGGFAAVLAMFVCHYLFLFGGKDVVEKHGISNNVASRLGGVAIVFYIACHLSYQALMGMYSLSAAEGSIFIIAFAYFLLGVIEDLTGTLSARLRFTVMLVLAMVALFIAPQLILSPVGLPPVDIIVENPMLATIFTSLCIAFIPNAFNTADGANGLVAGIALAVMFALSRVAPQDLQPLLAAGAVGSAVFLVFNLLGGRFFLGDGGAYFLGALCGLCMIVVANRGDTSVWMLLSMVFYPVADLIWSMWRRFRRGAPVFGADNSHCHNLIFTGLRAYGLSSQSANTASGVGVALVFAWAPAVLFVSGVVAAGSAVWLGVVVFQTLIYGTLFNALRAHVAQDRAIV